MLMPEPMLSGGTAFCHPGTMWQCSLPRTRRRKCHPPLHGCFKYTGVWGLLEWGLDQGQLVATPATAWTVNSVSTAVCHIGSGPHVGTSPIGQHIRFHCDNLQLSRLGLTSHPNTSVSWLLRTLFFTASDSFTVSLVHLPGWLNYIANALSRNLMTSCHAFFSGPTGTLISNTTPPLIAEL